MNSELRTMNNVFKKLVSLLVAEIFLSSTILPVSASPLPSHSHLRPQDAKDGGIDKELSQEFQATNAASPVKNGDSNGARDGGKKSHRKVPPLGASPVSRRPVRIGIHPSRDELYNASVIRNPNGTVVTSNLYPILRGKARGYGGFTLIHIEPEQLLGVLRSRDEVSERRYSVVSWAIQGGAKLSPIAIGGLTPSGKLNILDGNHRAYYAAEHKVPVLAYVGNSVLVQVQEALKGPQKKKSDMYLRRPWGRKFWVGKDLRFQVNRGEKQGALLSIEKEGKHLIDIPISEGGVWESTERDLKAKGRDGGEYPFRISLDRVEMHQVYVIVNAPGTVLIDRDEARQRRLAEAARDGGADKIDISQLIARVNTAMLHADWELAAKIVPQLERLSAQDLSQLSPETLADRRILLERFDREDPIAESRNPAVTRAIHDGLLEAEGALRGKLLPNLARATRALEQVKRHQYQLVGSERKELSLLEEQLDRFKATNARDGGRNTARNRILAQAATSRNRRRVGAMTPEALYAQHLEALKTLDRNGSLLNPQYDPEHQMPALQSASAHRSMPSAINAIVLRNQVTLLGFEVGLSHFKRWGVTGPEILLVGDPEVLQAIEVEKGKTLYDALRELEDLYGPLVRLVDHATYRQIKQSVGEVVEVGFEKEETPKEGFILSGIGLLRIGLLKDSGVQKNLDPRVKAFIEAFAHSELYLPEASLPKEELLRLYESMV